eukprot:6212171-Pleurochrysis_carterae.AAC.2
MAQGASWLATTSAAFFEAAPDLRRGAGGRISIEKQRISSGCTFGPICVCFGVMCVCISNFVKCACELVAGAAGPWV